MQAKRQSTFYGLLALVAVFFIFGLRVHTIHSTYMREDEEIAFRTTTNHPVTYTIWYNTQQDVHTPTWFVSFWAWQQFVGSSEFAARVYSILLSLLSLGLTYRIGCDWFGGPRYGLFAVVILGVNAFALVYALEIRPYALVMVASALSMWLFQRWLVQPTWRRALWYGASVSLLMWVHYYNAFLIAVQVVFVLLGRPSRRLLQQAVGAWALAFGLWLPLLPVFVGQILNLARAEIGGGDYRGLGIGSTTQLTSLPVITELATIVTNGLIPLYLLLLIMGLGLPLRQRNYWLALAWAIGAPAINLLVNLVASVYTQRYVTYVSIGLALAVGAVLASLSARFGLRWVGLVVTAGISLWMLPTQLPQHTPYRDIFQTVSDLAQSDDTVYFKLAREDGHWIGWQVDHYLKPELRDDMTNDYAAARAARRVWFITGDWFADAVQSEFRALEQTHPLQVVIGQCNNDWCYLAQLMEAPPEDEPTTFGERMAFWGTDVRDVTRESVTVRLWWRVAEPPQADYSIGLQLIDSRGILVAQSDGPVNHYNAEIFQTSQLEPGKIYIDYRTLTLPPDTAPGDYDLILLVYQSWDGVRLTLADGADHLNLRTIQIP